MRTGFDRIGHTITEKQARKGCLDKHPYDSRNDARDHAAKLAKCHPEWAELRPYRCTICHGYHLTTSTRHKGKA